MMHRLVRIAVVVLLAGAGLALARGSDRRVSDLDALSDAELTADLTAELDDILEHLEPNQEYPVAQLREEILDALSDEGDEGEEEEEIDFEDLDEEMAEAGTTTDACVANAVNLADEFSSIDAAPANRVQSLVRNVSFEEPVQGRKRNGFATSRTAIDRSVKAIIVDVRKVRR
ncbi:MAG: hypothetical protein H7066_23230 [Cytophagaceae bacterium]|nr:hypothetical protein [Gemmatimonadaceae bacterium]